MKTKELHYDELYIFGPPQYLDAEHQRTGKTRQIIEQTDNGIHTFWHPNTSLNEEKSNDAENSENLQKIGIQT